MENIKFDFSKTDGIIKPMHAVNNGPRTPGVRGNKTNFEAYKAARIPYARNHDASFDWDYGGEHIVDVHRIFKNFDADENDPASYIFEPTDKYLKDTLDAGTKIFYRLGASIEHLYKYGTRVPKDFAKWARICEHIIMHYNEGWANGFNWDIEYWEIWNEPDCGNAEGSNPCWQGTEDEFVEFYEVAAKYLKGRFPDLKIGGPAFTGIWTRDFVRKFLNNVKAHNVPLDFFSYHWYEKFPEKLKETLDQTQIELELAGLSGTPTILNEWNYVRAWSGDAYEYSMETLRNHKGASFVTSVMCVAQENPLDMLMYYEARPCSWSGLFDGIKTYIVYKPYYTFCNFANLYEMESYVKAENEVKDVYTCAARGEDASGILLTYYNENDDGFHKELPIAEKSKKLGLEIVNPYPGEKIKVEYFITDETHDNEIIKEETVSDDNFRLEFEAPLYGVYYIKLSKI